MKPIMAILVLSMTLFADQIFTFDDLSEYETNGNVQTTDKAMGQGLFFSPEDTSNVVIPNVEMPDSFTFVFWVRRHRYSEEVGSRDLIEFGDVKFWIEYGSQLRARNAEKNIVDKRIYNEATDMGYLEGTMWWPIVWTRRAVDNGFSTTIIDSVFNFHVCVGATKYNVMKDTNNVHDIIVGKYNPDTTNEEGKREKAIYIDHVCIFDNMASVADYQSIEELYAIDETFAVNRTRSIKTKKVAVKAIYNALGRKVSTSLTSIHINISNGQRTVRKNNGYNR